MGDREIPQFNRVIFAKWGNRTQELHLQRLRKDIKPVIDTTPPPSFAHLADRRKIKQKWSDEQSRIEYENMLLLTKLRGIMSETQNKQFLAADKAGSAQGGSQSILLGTGAASEQNKGSLNRGERIKEMKRILHENESLLHRIQNRGPTYSVANWEREHVLKEKQLAGMGRFNYVSTTLPPAVMAELARPKVIKRYGTMRFPVPKPGQDDPYSMSPSRHFASTSSLVSAGEEDESATAASQQQQGSASQPTTPGKASSTTPRRVHHLPPKYHTEEKQQSSAKKATSAGKKRKPVEAKPIELSLQLEQITGHLNDPSDQPRVFIYFRQDSGEYLCHTEVALQPLDLPHGPAWRGVTLVPGLGEKEDDKRIRLAIFSPADPIFAAPTSDDGTLVVPKDNTFLIGEARFSLAHFTSFTRPLYKLKVLRHGLPIAGPKFGEGGTAPSDLSEEEVERRRQLPEAILVLQHLNKQTDEQAVSPARAAAPSSKVTSPVAETKEQEPPSSAEADAAAVAAAEAAAKRAEAEEKKAAAAEKKRVASAQKKKEAAEKAAAAAEAQAKKDAEAEEKKAAAAAAAEEKARAASADKKARAQSADKKARAASAAKKKAAATIDPKQTKLQQVLSSSAGKVYTGSAKEGASELFTAGVDPDFLQEHLQAAKNASIVYGPSASDLTQAVSAAGQVQSDSRTAVYEALGASSLLPVGALLESEVDDLAKDAALPLSALKDVCEKNSSELMRVFPLLQKQGLKFKQWLHLSQAIKTELAKSTSSSTPAAADQNEAATKIQALQRGKAARQAAKKKSDGEAQAPAKSAADVLAEIQSTKAAQEAEVARVMAEKGLKPDEPEPEEEFSKPYVEDEPAPATATAAANDEFPADFESETPAKPAEPAVTASTGKPIRKPKNRDEAATKIQALQRGRSVRARKAALLAERLAAKEEARARKIALQKEREQEARDDAAAAAKLAAEAEAKKKREEELAEQARQEKEAEAALLAKAKQEEQEAKEKAAAEALARQESATRDAEAKAAEETRKKAELEAKKAEAEAAKAKADAEAKAKADAEAQAKAAEAEAAKAAAAALEAKIAEQVELLKAKNFNVTLQVGCKSIPGLGSATPSPMVALYQKDAATGSFTFVSQSERIQGSANPLFAEPLLVQGVNGREDRQLMFSVYNVANEDAIKEEDVTGTALLNQKDLFKSITRLAAGEKFQTISLQIAQNGSIVKDAFVTIVNLTYEEGSTLAASSSTSAVAAAAEPFVIPEGEVGIWVSIKNLVLPDGVTEANSLAALYTKDHESSNFNYLSQTDIVAGLAPKFTTPLCIAKPAAGHDTDCMLNVYNHLDENAEVSDANALGACLFSLNKLLASSKGAVAVSLVRGGAVCGQVILKTRQDASSTNVTRPNTAVRSNPAGSSSAKPTLDVYDISISCSKLPLRATSPVCEPMASLYGQSAATQQFEYIGQTEKAGSADPVFESTIRLDEHSGGGPDGDRALMLMIYDVADESNIQETDQIGTVALTWKYLKESAQSHNQQVTLPLLTTSGEQHPDAKITIKIQKV